jgi:ADP-ribosylglycohydrolase
VTLWTQFDVAGGSRSDRAIASIVAGALGDAFGYEVEFDTLEAIRQRFGPAGLTEPVRHGGQLIVSDDTQMTLFTLEGLIRGRAPSGDLHASLNAIRDAYLDWYRTQEPMPQAGAYRGRLGAQPAMWHARAPGGTCLSALASGGKGTPDRPANHSKGCGGVMRVAPIGVAPGLGDDAARFDLAQRAAALTHGHPGGYRPAGAMAVLLHGLVLGRDPQTALDAAMSQIETPCDGDETARLVAEAQRLAAAPGGDHARNVARLGRGWVGDEALAIAVYAAFAARSFREALAIAANHDGDSDSTASLAGQIWAARLGRDGIPEDWIHDLDVGDAMLPLLHNLVWPQDRTRPRSDHDEVEPRSGSTSSCESDLH